MSKNGWSFSSLSNEPPGSTATEEKRLQGIRLGIEEELPDYKKGAIWADLFGR